MVDINLFKDEDEEGSWTPEEPGNEDLSHGVADADLGFDDDLTETPSLDAESILDEEDVLPDFEEPEEERSEEDYEFGDVQGKRTPVWLWAVLGILVVCVFVYLFVIQPRQRGLTDASSRLTRRTETSSIQAEEASGSTGTELAETEGVPVSEEADRSVSRMMDTPAEEAAPIGVVVDASTGIVEALSSTDRLGAVLIAGNRFFVEYVSETARVSESIGESIQALTGAARYVASPEERHRRGDDVRYSGVVSGTLPAGRDAADPEDAAPYETTDHFIASMRSLIGDYRLTVSRSDKLSEIGNAGARRSYARIRVEGSKAQALEFLRALKDQRGAYDLVKLLFVPQSYTDYGATQVKVVMDFLVTVG